MSLVSKLYSSINLLYPAASSVVLSCFLCTFSTNPITAASLVLTSLIKQGTDFSPASLEALSLLSPAISLYSLGPTSWTIKGCKIPFLVIDWLSSDSFSLSKFVRACVSLLLIKDISISIALNSLTFVSVISELSDLFICSNSFHDFFC